MSRRQRTSVNENMALKRKIKSTQNCMFILSIVFLLLLLGLFLAYLLVPPKTIYTNIITAPINNNLFSGSISYGSCSSLNTTTICTSAKTNMYYICDNDTKEIYTCSCNQYDNCNWIYSGTFQGLNKTARGCFFDKIENLKKN
jgi:hypothetical protein